MPENTPLKPKLRQLHPQPIIYQGEPFLLLRDPLQLRRDTLLLPQPLAPLLLLCDGTRDREAIQTVLSTHFGILIKSADLDHFLQTFADLLLLENEASKLAHQQALQAYREAEYRPPALAGKTYPANPAKLHKLLQDLLEEADTQPDSNPGLGILSPHIDFARGGSVYARVWKRAAKMIQEAELIVILATDHYGGLSPITLTRQHYATPYGVIPTDQQAVNALAQAVGEDIAFEGELYHSQEHSIELVAVWLHHLRHKNPSPILPILCGAFEEHLYNGTPIEANQHINTVVQTLREITRERRTFFVISGDLSHVGPAFGGEALDEEARIILKGEDEALLHLIQSGNASEFYQSIQQSKDKNNVCGTTPIYIALRSMAPANGELVAYALCPADERDTSLVSITGVVFKKSGA